MSPFQRIALSSAVAAIAGFQIRAYLLWDRVRLGQYGLIEDDAYFVTVVAHNVARLGRFTFDGEMSTNGFQPLWMAIQIGLNRIFPDTSADLLIARSSWVSYVLFAFLATWWLTSWKRRNALLRVIVFSGLIVFNLRFQRLAVTGLEISLNVALLTFAAVLVERFSAPGEEENLLRRPGRLVALAVAGALCFFARTDLFWVPIVLGAWIWIRSGRDWRGPTVFFAMIGVLVVPYLAFNVVMQDALMPVSGQVKRFYMNSFYPTWGDYLRSPEWRGFFNAQSTWMPGLPLNLVYVLAGAFAVAFPILTFHPKTRELFPPSLRFVTVTVLAHLLFMLFFYRQNTNNYYFAPESLWLASSLALLVSAAPALGPLRWASSRAFLVAASVGLIVLVGLADRYREHTRAPNPYWRARIDLARSIPDEVPGARRIAAFWPGAVAEFSGLPVVPLDGVIGSREFFTEYVQAGRQLDYLDERGIRFVVIHLASGPELLFADERPEIDRWWDLGIVRLWERRERLRVRLAATYGGGGRGWYLIELTER